MQKRDIAWRGFVTKDLEVVAWPTVLVDHNTFHATFGTSDEDFAARWRQWSEGDVPDIDDERGLPEDVVDAIYHFLAIKEGR